MFVVRDSSRAAFDTVVLHDEVAGSRVEVVPTRGALVTSFEARGRKWLYLDEGTLADASQNVRGGCGWHEQQTGGESPYPGP